LMLIPLVLIFMASLNCSPDERSEIRELSY
jgi:hypothetical protein